MKDRNEKALRQSSRLQSAATVSSSICLVEKLVLIAQSLVDSVDTARSASEAALGASTLEQLPNTGWSPFRPTTYEDESIGLSYYGIGSTPTTPRPFLSAIAHTQGVGVTAAEGIGGPDMIFSTTNIQPKTTSERPPG